MEPFLALMRRYCFDYTCVHDLSQIDQIMSSEYEITISGKTLRIDEYRHVVSAAFRRHPTLALTVHEMMLSGDRLAMRFSEHGATGGDGSALAVWSGIAVYRWNGRQLLSCRVEQDFLGRDQQGESGTVACLEPAHPDPWATTISTPSAPGNEATVREWLDRYAAAPDAERNVVRLLEDRPSGPILARQQVEVHDLFSVGDRVAASVTFRGEYAEGLPVDDDVTGTACELPATLIATVVGGKVDTVSLVRDRWGLVRRLRKRRRPDS